MIFSVAKNIIDNFPWGSSNHLNIKSRIMAIHWIFNTFFPLHVKKFWILHVILYWVIVILQTHDCAYSLLVLNIPLFFSVPCRSVPEMPPQEMFAWRLVHRLVGLWTWASGRSTVSIQQTSHQQKSVRIGSIKAYPDRSAVEVQYILRIHFSDSAGYCMYSIYCSYTVLLAVVLQYILHPTASILLFGLGRL